MADPTIQTFCCHNRNHSDAAVKIMYEFDSDSYILVCLFSSFVGILGASYQIFCRSQVEQTNNRRLDNRRFDIGRKIIMWLAVADLCASLGVFVRSALWKYVKDIMPVNDDAVSVAFCAISSAWTQYFYTCTWIWTLLYALNIRKSLLGKPINESTCHFITWTTSAALVAAGLTVLYIPDADCHDIHQISTALFRVLPNYIFTYGPMVVVMIMNPILYLNSSKEIDLLLTAPLSQSTLKERQIMDTFKLKYSFINVIFYICWLPNLINGLILWFFWFDLPVKLIITTWYIMAITNPLQAFLNTLVYRKWTVSKNREAVSPIHSQMSEVAPLLNRPAALYTSDVNDVELSVDDSLSRFSVNSCSCL